MVYPTRSERDPTPRRRIRSESDRKKHAGWRSCPRCSKSVSTNGRNFYHHMQKCDPVFFADLIASLDAAKKAPKSAPALPSSSAVAAASHSSSLTMHQRVQFLQQLCFLRIYDRVVDDVLKSVEQTSRVLNKAVFESVRQAKRQQSAKSLLGTPASYSPAPLRRFPPVPLPEQFASPMTVQREGREQRWETERYWEGRDTTAVLSGPSFSTGVGAGAGAGAGAGTGAVAVAGAVAGVGGGGTASSAGGSGGAGGAGGVGGSSSAGGASVYTTGTGEVAGLPFSSGRREGESTHTEGAAFSSGFSSGFASGSPAAEPPASSGGAAGSSRPASAMSISSVINN